MRIIHTKRHRLHATDQCAWGDPPFATEEVPARVEAILAAVRDSGIGEIIEPADHGLEPIAAAHDAGFIEYLRTAYEQAGGPVFVSTFVARRAPRSPTHFQGLKGYYAYGDDSPILEGTWEAAYWSAQCALTGAELLRAGERAAYALCRPPGHHAACDLYGGACYLNNAAVAARRLGPGTAILDIDYHHGNGTQDIFYSDPSILYCSLHADPDAEYPYYWGGADERGIGPGTGFNRNWPLPVGTQDSEYLVALGEALAAVREFDPSYLVVSVGFDTIEGDPWGGFRLTTAGLREVGRRIAAAGVPTLLVQEGGYLVERLGECAVAFLAGFTGTAA